MSESQSLHLAGLVLARGGSKVQFLQFFKKLGIKMFRVFLSRISHPWAPALSSAGVFNLSWSLESVTQSGYLLTIRYHNKDIIKILNEFTKY